jgi:hypothetical protein
MCGSQSRRAREPMPMSTMTTWRNMVEPFLIAAILAVYLSFVNIYLLLT